MAFREVEVLFSTGFADCGHVQGHSRMTDQEQNCKIAIKIFVIFITFVIIPVFIDR